MENKTIISNEDRTKSIIIISIIKDNKIDIAIEVISYKLPHSITKYIGDNLSEAIKIYNELP